MSHSATVIGGGIVLGIGSMILNAVLPHQAFMTVNEIRVEGGQVTADRKINVPTMVADWRVTVVPVIGDAPACQTIPGPMMHQGWSRYSQSEPEQVSMSMDEWVGDEGCADRLAGGDHKMFITWTPRDGSAPVVEIFRFEWTE